LDSIETWFFTAFFAGFIFIVAGIISMFVFRKSDAKLSYFFNGRPDEPVPLWLKPRLELVRAEKRRVVYGLLFVGAAVAMIDVLIYAALVIARSLGAT